MAIRIPYDAKHRPVPEGPGRERIATSGFALLAMTAFFVERKKGKDPGLMTSQLRAFPKRKER